MGAKRPRELERRSGVSARGGVKPVVEEVLGVVEAGVTDGWWKYGCAAVVGIDSFGESAPG